MDKNRTRKLDYRTEIYCTNTTVLDVPVVEEADCDIDEMKQAVQNSRKLLVNSF